MNSVSISLINLIVLILLTRTESFTLKHTFQTQLIQKPTTYRLGPIYLFGKGKDESKEVNGDDQPNEKKSSTFFGRLKRQKGVETVEVATVEKIEASPVKESEDPAAMAKTLRAQAERARLEAERMDAELTLQKIEKLERELVQAKNKGDSVEDLQRQLDNLQAKLRGEPPKPVVAKTTAERRIADKDTDVVVNDTNTPPATISSSTSYLGDLEFQDLEETIELVERSPGFIRKLMASIVELEYDTKADLNKTEIAVRLSKMATADYSYSSLSKPVFTKEQISEAAKKIDEKSSDLGYPSNFVKLAEGNVTKLAEYALEYEYYLNSRIGDDDQALQLIAKVGEDEEWMQGLLSALNQTSVDRSIETLYPKCTRKEGEEPTMAQIQSLAANVLPSAKFSSSSKPEKVLGGYVIRGSHKYESGDDLIEAIDRELAKTSLGDKMTVLYTPDFTVFAQADEDDFDLDLFDPAEIPPVLYITGPDIARERQQLLLSVTSAFGLATSWYLSIYPFLLNPALAKRVDEQLVLADASMSYDLAWLTDLSVPLFLTFIGIQLSHELAHRVVGSFSDVSFYRGFLQLFQHTIASPFFFADETLCTNFCAFYHHRYNKHSYNIQGSTEKQGSHVRFLSCRALGGHSCFRWCTGIRITIDPGKRPGYTTSIAVGNSTAEYTWWWDHRWYCSGIPLCPSRGANGWCYDLSSPSCYCWVHQSCCQRP